MGVRHRVQLEMLGNMGSDSSVSSDRSDDQDEDGGARKTGGGQYLIDIFPELRQN